MTRILLYFIPFLIFFSCRTDGDIDENVSLEGSWQPTKVKVYVPNSGGLLSQTEEMNACQLKSRVNYFSGKAGHEIAYETNCDLRYDRDFTYSFDVKTRKLTQKYPTHENSVSVVSLTQTTLVIRTKRNVDGSDYDIEITSSRL